MSKARDLADFISTGAGTGILADGAIDTTEITGVTVSSTEINRLAGVGADVQTQINAKAATSSLAAVATSGAYSDVTGTPSLGTAAALNVGTAASNIPQLDGTGKLPAIDGSQLTGLGVTQGTLTKTFAQNETAEITLGQAVTPAPVVSATKEVPQTGVSTKGNWDVNSTASNYDFHNTAANVTLTPSAFNISSYSNKKQYSLNTSQSNASYDIFLKPDGTKLYITNGGSGGTGNLITYNLSTAWDVTTASYANEVFDTTATESWADGLWFKPDGTYVYLTSQNESGVISYYLSTAWDVSTASNLATENLTSISAPKGLTFKPDGTIMYVGDPNNKCIRQYALSTAWDITTSSLTSTQNTQTQGRLDSQPTSISFNPDGTIMFLNDTYGAWLQKFTLSTAWDITSITYDSELEYNGSGINAITDGNAWGHFMDASGSRLYFTSYIADKITQIELPTSLALGSGSFAATDVGKRIVGNGGDVILTSTAGAFDTTGGSAFTDSSTIAAGSWSMFGVQPTTSGISINRKIDGAYDVSSSTISPSSVLSTVSGKFSATVPNGGAFVHPDGTMLFVNEEYNIRRYDMSTPHDLSTLSTAVHTYNIGTSDNKGLTFRPDGLRMYTVDESYLRIRTYTLSTAWDITSISSTATITGFSAVGSDNYLQNIKFNPDGTKMYGLYYQGNNQLQSYDLSTPYDVTTSSNMKQNGGGVGFANYNNLRDFAFVNNGSAALATRDGSNQIYYCEMTTPYDISTFVNNTLDQWQGGTGSGAASYITAIAEQDGKFYGINSTNNEYVWNWSIKTATSLPDDYFVSVTNSGGQIDTQYWTDINSMTADQTANAGTVNYAVSTDGRTTWSVAKGTDGVRPIVRNNSGTWQYNSAESAWGISSASYTSTSLNVNSIEPNPTGIFFKPDGTKMYMNGYTNDDVNEYNLSTAWDITTATYSQNFGLSSQDTSSQGIFFKPDGTKMYMVGSGSDNINEYTLSTAWDVSTLSYVRNLGMPSGLQNPTGIFFKSDGTRMYIVADPNKAVMYSLSTAWDISTASVSHTHTISENSLPQDIFLKSDGTKVYILGESPDKKVYEYNLSTAYDLSTISYSSNSFNVEPQSPGCKAMTFKPDGSKMYILGTDNDVIYEYNTLSYGTSATWSNGTVNDELYTLQQALSLESNRMDKTQLDAVADANHFPTGSSLDLMIALQMTNDGGVRPVSDGVTINFDAEALNEGAVLGTDYDYFFPANNKVQIKSLAAQNLKVRVV